MSRERRPDGNDICAKGHTFPSKDTIPPKLDSDVATISGAATYLLNALHNAGLQPSSVMLVVRAEDFRNIVMHVTHREAQGDDKIEIELPGPGFGVRINGLRITAI